MQHSEVSLLEEQPVAARDGIRSAGRFIPASAAMREILDLVRKIAGSDVPVLIQGEMGAGKQAVAREIHRRSRRAAGPFVRVACGALREPELEERLFGPPCSAFQAAEGRRPGLLASSQGGTLFLDGVVELPFWAQVKLLDALQPGGDYRPRNGGEPACDARVIASSRDDLETAMAENRFYSGLYYHLDAVRIDVPALRHRQEDIRALAEHFLAAAGATLGSAGHGLPRHFSEGAWQTLLQYAWPGNVLQLAAVVTHAAMLADGPEIGQARVAGLLDRVRRHPNAETISVSLAGGLKEMELALVHEVIRRCRGNKAAAARALRVHRRTLYRLLQE
jgi:DNA-binding NtrC family response regulator